MVRIDSRVSPMPPWRSARRGRASRSARGWVVVVVLVFFVSIAAQSGLAKDDVRATATRDRVHRNRIITLAVAKIGESLQPNCDAEILRLVQLVLDHEPDSFEVEDLVVVRNPRSIRPEAPVKDSGPLSSAHAIVESKLSRGGMQLVARYETQFGAEANRLLGEARANQSIAGLRSVCRRFFLTSAGYAAGEELVFRWLDAGEYDLAAQLATQILSEPTHHDRIRPRFREIAGQLNAVANRMESGKGPESVAPEVTAFPRQFLRNRESMQLFETGWMTFGGNLTRNRIVSGTDPIPVPEWHLDYFPQESRQLIQDFLTEWEGQQKEVDQPCSPAAYPIVARGRVIFRDSTGVRCVSVTTGKTEWSFSCHRDLWSEVRLRYDQHTRQPHPGSPYQRRPYHLATNSIMGAISTDGRLVYAIDGNPPFLDDDADALDVFAHPRFHNRLLGLQLEPTSPQGILAWTNTGVVNSDASSISSGGEVSRLEAKSGGSKRMSFLGPPLPGATELLCLTEHDDEIHLTALVPTSGTVVWSQPLCTLERSERVDVERHDTACVPARSEGIVVCPTGTGLLVAVDQSRARLLWAVYLDDINERNFSQTRGANRAVPFSYGGYPSYCQIANGQVVYLSPRGSQLYCLELTTGRILWNVPRNEAEFLGTIADQRVVVVGRQGCRCHSLVDGKSLWTTSIESPNGCGLAIGNHYLLPLDAGRLAMINLQTGRDEGTQILRSNVPLGHLAADGDRVYSLSQRGLISFSQVHHSLTLLSELNPGRQIDRKAELIRAEIALVKNDPQEGERHLKLALGGGLLGADRLRASRELKGILFERIARGTDVTDADCDRLNQLLETPAEEFRFLVILAQPDRVIRGRQSRREQIRRIYRLPADVTCAMPEDDRWIVSPAVWCRIYSPDVDSSDVDPEIANLKKDQDPASPELRVEECDELKRFIRVFDRQAVAELARMRLGSAYEVEGSPHASEILWLRNRASSNPQVAADACLRLIDLWEHVGFINDAARQLESLQTTFAETRLSNGLTGAECIRRMDPNHPVLRFWRQSREPGWRVNRVDISQSRVGSQFVPLTIRNESKKEAGTGHTNRAPTGFQGRHEQIPGQPCGFFITGGNAVEQPTTVSVTDQRTMVSLGSFTSPLDARWPKADRSLSGSHFLLLGTRGGTLGISTAQLSEGEPVWAQQPSELAGLRIAAFPGPWGASFAAFTWRNRMYVVDPLDGALLWQRTISSVPKESLNNVRLDLVGDGSAIAIQSMDHATYEVFETATGRLLPTVKPSLNMSEVIGRHLYGISEGPKGSRLQIRDLMKESPDIDEPIVDKIRKPIELSGGEVAFLSGSEVKIYDVVDRRMRFSTKLDDSEVSPFNMSKILSDDDRYYLNLGRPTSTAPTKLTNQALADTPIPSITIKDDLYAFDRATGELLWKRSLPLRTVVQFPECQVPFLVTISQVKDSMSSAPQSLTIEVIDSKTGMTLGYRENLTLDRLTSAEYDGLQGRIKLRGQSTEIELRFGPDDWQSLRDTRPTP